MLHIPSIPSVIIINLNNKIIENYQINPKIGFNYNKFYATKSNFDSIDTLENISPTEFFILFYGTFDDLWKFNLDLDSGVYNVYNYSFDNDFIAINISYKNFIYNFYSPFFVFNNELNYIISINISTPDVNSNTLNTMVKYNKIPNLIFWWEPWSFYNFSSILEYNHTTPWYIYRKYRLSMWSNWHVLEDRFSIFFIVFFFILA